MELKLIELLMTEPLVFVGMAVAVWILTYIVKKPIKNMTSKIKNEQKRKLCNKWVLLIPFVLALALYFVYHGITTKMWLADYELILSSAFSIAVLSITIYNVFEGIKGKKTEYETTDDGVALYNLLMIYAKDKEKVKLLLDQCKANLFKGFYSVADTVKGFLPEDTDPAVIDTITKTIEKYLNKVVIKK